MWSSQEGIQASFESTLTSVGEIRWKAFTLKFQFISIRFTSEVFV